MASLSGVNTNAEPSSSDYELLPISDYKIVIESEEVKTGQKSGENYLNLKIRVIDGEYKNRVLFHMLNLWTTATYIDKKDGKEKPVKAIAERELASIKIAAGLQTITDTVQLQMRPMVVSVGQKEDSYGKKNTIRGWKPLTGNFPSAGGSKPSATQPTSSGGSSAIRAHIDDDPSMPDEMRNF